MICDDAFELKTLACLYKLSEFDAVACRHLKPHYFSSAVRQNLAKLAIDFYNKYHTPMTINAACDALKKMVEKNIIVADELKVYGQSLKNVLSTDVADYEYILDKLIIFIKHRETRSLIEKAVEKYLPNENFGELETHMKRIINMSTLKDVEPINYLDSITDRIQVREEEKDMQVVGIPTGIPMLDRKMMDKGWEVDNLYLILGGAKAGKSMALCYFANTAFKMGYNVVYFSCETSEKVLSSRFDAMNADVEINNLPHHNSSVYTKLKEIETNGTLWVYDYPPRRLTSDMVEEKINRLSAEKGIHVDLIVVDYLDIMHPSHKYDDKWQEETGMCEDLRAVAKILHVPIITASQINRIGAKKQVITGSDVAGSWGKIATADMVLTLSKSKESDSDIVVRIAESRNFPTCAFKVKTKYGFGRFYEDFVEEVYE